MKETWKMIALLALALGSLLAYALLPEEVAENLPLKQMGMEALVSKEEGEGELEEADSITNEPTDTTSQRVLIFGDSMSEYLGLRMADYTNKNGHKLTCVTWVSSGTRNWATSDTLQHFIERVRPTHVFVCLGSNELYTADMKGCERRIRAILAKIGNIPTVWIGPPNWCEDKGYNRLLRSVMGPRGYFPSYRLHFDRQKDGRHPTMASSAMWMDKIVEWINTGHGVHPFRLEKPDKRDRHYRQVIILPPGTKSQHGTYASTDSLAQPADVETAAPMPAEAPAPAVESPSPTVKHTNHKDSI